VSNYGLTIAYSLGIFDRALEPFPAAMDAYRHAKRQADASRGRAGQGTARGVGQPVEHP
jgi:hypothetical protein